MSQAREPYTFWARSLVGLLICFCALFFPRKFYYCFLMCWQNCILPWTDGVFLHLLNTVIIIHFLCSNELFFTKMTQNEKFPRKMPFDIVSYNLYFFNSISKFDRVFDNYLQLVVKNYITNSNTAYKQNQWPSHFCKF